MCFCSKSISSTIVSLHEYREVDALCPIIPRTQRGTQHYVICPIGNQSMNEQMNICGRQLQTPQISLSLYAETSHKQLETSREPNIVFPRHISLQSNCNILGLEHSTLSLLPVNKLADSATNNPVLYLHSQTMTTYTEVRGMKHLFKDSTP